MPAGRDVRSELMTLEKQYWNAIMKKDAATATSLSDDPCLVAYKVKEDLAVASEKILLEAFDSSLWIRRDGKWRCALHTESLAGDPFGRR